MPTAATIDLMCVALPNARHLHEENLFLCTIGPNFCGMWQLSITEPTTASFVHMYRVAKPLSPLKHLPNPHAAKTLLRGTGSVVHSRQATISATPSHPSAGSVSPTT